jgi:phenylalanine ammonia-lyase
MYDANPVLTSEQKRLQNIQKSADLINQQLKNRYTVYGVISGSGGSADTRTTRFEDLQIALQQYLNVGILLPSDKGNNAEKASPIELLREHTVPVPVVKAITLIRYNSLT